MDEKTLIVIEQTVNRLMRDPRTDAMRYGAPKWVDRRLSDGLEERLQEELGISEECWRLFSGGREPEFALVSEKALSTLELSAQRKREFRFLASDNPKAAAEWLTERLRAKERVAFRKRAGIPAATWKRFWESTTYTSEDTAERIVRALSLSEEEEGELRSLIVREFFDVEPLKPEVWSRLKRISITDFLQRSYISQKAWEPFRRNSREGVTSQGTLLKMIVGFRMPPEEGWEFLSAVGSGFVMPRDLLVLACMHCGIYEVYEISEVLDRFSTGYGGGRLFGNLYRNIG